MPTVQMKILQTLQPKNDHISTTSLSSILPSLSCYASPIIASTSNELQNRRKLDNKKKKRGLIDQIIVTVRNIHGEEFSDIIWPTTFIPLLSFMGSNEQTFNYQTISSSYFIPSTISLNNISFLILPPKYELTYSNYFQQLADIDIQKILHKYRIQYRIEDIFTTDSQSLTEKLTNDNNNNSNSDDNNINLSIDDIQLDTQEDIDFREADRLASLLSINYDDDNYDNNINININNINDNININNNDILSDNQNSLDHIFSELSSKLSYLNSSQDENLDEENNILFTNERFVFFYELLKLLTFYFIH